MITKIDNNLNYIIYKGYDTQLRLKHFDVWIWRIYKGRIRHWHSKYQSYNRNDSYEADKNFKCKECGVKLSDFWILALKLGKQ